MFTYRDFEGGTLGLAWTGDLKNAGGVCEKNGVNFEIFILDYINHSTAKTYYCFNYVIPYNLRRTKSCKLSQDLSVVAFCGLFTFTSKNTDVQVYYNVDYWSLCSQI